MARRLAAAILVFMMLVGVSGCIVRPVDTGAMATEVRDVPEFDAIDFAGFGSMVIEQGAGYEVELTGTESVLQRVDTDVRGGTLRVGQDSPWSLWPFFLGPQRLEVRVVVPSLERVVVSGAGDVSIDGLEGERVELGLSGAGTVSARDVDLDRLVVELSGAGSARVSGVVDTQEVTLSGAGDYDGRDLESRNARVEVSGAGSVVVWAEERLDVRASGAGSVEYYGDPQVRSDVSGASSVTGRGRP